MWRTGEEGDIFGLSSAGVWPRESRWPAVTHWLMGQLFCSRHRCSLYSVWRWSTQCSPSPRLAGLAWVSGFARLLSPGPDRKASCSDWLPSRFFSPSSAPTSTRAFPHDTLAVCVSHGGVAGVSSIVFWLLGTQYVLRQILGFALDRNRARRAVPCPGLGLYSGYSSHLTIGVRLVDGIRPRLER